MKDFRCRLFLMMLRNKRLLFCPKVPENRQSTAEDALRSQYLQAKYVVFDKPEELVLHVGQKNQGLDVLLERESAQTWAFLTAYNPYSKQLTKSENEARQAELIQSLNSENLRFIDGYGASDEPGEWEAEPSVLILGIEKEAALAIARRFEQNAILYGRIFEEPELVWV